MMRSSVALRGATLAALMFIAACGQKGPLVLPPASNSASAPAR
jgi:predicted small lipoprotein YifL